MSSKIVIGFTGKNCSGKGDASKYLSQKYGFEIFTLSDQIREEIRNRNLEITRERLAEVGGELRDKFGSDILAKRAWEKIQEQGSKKAVVDGARSLGEMDFLNSLPNFHLIAIEASPEIRFERIKKRIISGQSDPTNWEDFLEAEKNDIEKFGMNIEEVMKNAQFHVTNEGSEEEFHQKLDEVISKLPT